jgi:hypothetical protein
MTGFSALRLGKREIALKVGFDFAIWRLVGDVSLDLFDWRWQFYCDGSVGAWIGPLWIDFWLIEPDSGRAKGEDNG